MSGIGIRRLTWHDIAAVRELEVALFPVDAWTTEQFWAELAQPSRHYEVAEREGQVVAYGGIMAIEPTADLQTIAVAPAEQGRGTGRALLASLVAAAAERRCSEMLLEVRDDNAAAIAVYERFGFEVIAKRTDYYATGIDALIMRLRPIEAP